MKPIILMSLFLFLTNMILATETKDFYTVFKSNSETKVEELLAQFESVENPTSDILAYIGALYIKRSNYISNMKQKIETFKIGRDIIESIIESNTDNIEYRFIRLIIQEQVPKILKYDKNKEEDSIIITENILSVDDILMSEITDYSKVSETLNFKN